MSIPGKCIIKYKKSKLEEMFVSVFHSERLNNYKRNNMINMDSKHDGCILLNFSKLFSHFLIEKSGIAELHIMSST